MAEFERISSTVRGGVTVDEVEIQVPDAPPTTGYLVGQRHDQPQPLVVALHDERGDKATLLPDLEHLAARGFLCLSVDSPITRRASAERDPLSAFDSLRAITNATLVTALSDPNVQSNRVALLGRGMGGEVAASVARLLDEVRVVVAMASLPDRSEFMRASAHPLAAGLRQFNDDDEVERQVRELHERRLVGQLEAAADTHWLLQVPEDDDRFSDADHATMSLSIPRTVRVDYVAHTRDLSSVKARRNRVDFISNLCG